VTAIDFDFGRYVAMRKGEVQQRARDGAAYSYLGERKVRRALASARPVLMALEATSRTWKKRGREDLLKDAELATDQRHPEVFKACAAASRVLALEAPSVYVTRGDFPPQARALGAFDDAYIIVPEGLLEHLQGPELVAVLGHELAHVQNNHIIYTTTLFYLRHSAAVFVRWIVQPAIMALQAWARRAAITCDRASLLCTRDLDATLRGLVKAALHAEGRNTDEAEKYLSEDLQGEGGIARFTEVFRSNPYLPKRLQALRVFSTSKFYRKFAGGDAEGLSAEEVDERVAKIL